MGAMYQELAESFDPELVGIVEWLMHLRAADRPQTAQSVLIALEGLLADDATRSRVPTMVLGTRETPTVRPVAPAPLASLSVEQIEGITTLLTEFLGPIAKILVKKAVASSNSFGQLRQSLSEEIENGTDRETFLSRVSKFLVQE